MSDDVDEERKQRADRLSRRFKDSNSSKTSMKSKTDKTEEPSNTSKPTDSEEPDTSKTSMKAKTAKTEKNSEDEKPVKERETVLMYLPDETKRKLSATFDQINARRTLDDKEKIEKNRDYFPAVIEVALEHVDEIENRLDE